MDASTLARLRSSLEEERAALVVQLQDIGLSPETGAPTAEVDFDHSFADSGAATAEKAGLLSVGTSLLETLREVEAALARMDEGTYGLCERCGDEIPEERLEARPQARMCVRCKQRSS